MDLTLLASLLKGFSSFGNATLVVIVIIGITGNMMTMAVFCCSKLKAISSFQYLTSLAVTDSLILLAYLLNSFLDVYSSSDYAFLIYLGTLEIAGLSSAWLMVAFSYNRFRCIQDPLHVKSKWIVTNTKSIIFSIFFVSAGFFVTNCLYGFYFNYRATIGYEIFMYHLKFLIPFPIVICLNLATYFILLKHKRKRENMTNSSNSNICNKYSVTKMLWICTLMSMFLVPRQFFYGIWLLHQIDWIEYDPGELVLEPTFQFFDIFASISYCGDFFVYCLSGKLFRSSLFDLISNVTKRYNCSGQLEPTI